ncbi:LIN9, partial [Acrasis kona]
EFLACVNELQTFDVSKIKKSDIPELRKQLTKKFGKPRRLSSNFLASERNKLYAYRNAVRAELLNINPKRLQVNDKALVYNENQFYTGTIQSVAHDSYGVKYDEMYDDKNIYQISDIYVMSLGKIHVTSFAPTSPIQHQFQTPVRNSYSTPNRTPGTPQIHISTPQRTISTSDIAVDLAAYIYHLRQKQQLVHSFRCMNDTARTLIESASAPEASSDPSSLYFSRDYVQLLLQLKNNNVSLDQSLFKLRRFQSQVFHHNPSSSINSTNLAQPYSHLLEPSSRIGQNETTSDVFNNNQSTANDVVNAISSEIGQHMDQKRSLIGGSSAILSSPNANNGSGPSNSNQLITSTGSTNAVNIVNVTNLVQNTRQIRGKVGECVAFLLHLQSCIHNMNASDVDLTLDAALMALKPSVMTPSSQQVYDDIKNMIRELKGIFGKK